MERKYGYFEWDSSIGSPGRKKDGSLSQNLFDSDGRLRGHGRFIPDDFSGLDDVPESRFGFSDPLIDGARASKENDEEPGAEVLVTLLGMFALFQAAPHVNRWWQEEAAPALTHQKQKIWAMLTKRPSSKHAPVPQAKEAEDSVFDDLQSASKKEVQALFTTLLAIHAQSDKLLQVVRGVGKLTDGEIEELQNSVAELSIEQLSALVSGIGNPEQFLSNVREATQLRPEIRPPRPLHHHNTAVRNDD